MKKRFTQLCISAVFGLYVLPVMGQLPVEISEFNGYNEGTTNVLQWITETEINNDYFQLERSEDAVNYEAIERVEGSGNSNSQQDYKAMDEDPYSTTYYRLKQVDVDGHYRYYGPVAITNDNLVDLVVYNVYPNPADHTFFIDIYLKDPVIANVDIYSQEGVVVYSNRINTTGHNKFEVESSTWSPGTYMVRLSSNDQKLQYSYKMIIK